MAEGNTGAQEIKRLEKGNTDRTSRHAEVMNEIIDRLNALAQMTVLPEGTGKLILSEANAVLKLTALGGCGDPPETGTYVCGAIDGNQTWLSTEECPCGIDGGTA